MEALLLAHASSLKIECSSDNKQAFVVQGDDRVAFDTGEYATCAGHSAPITRIELNSFYGSSTLRKVYIRSNVNTIGSSAFRNTELVEVRFDSSCKVFCDLWAFCGNTKLKSIYLPEGLQLTGWTTCFARSPITEITIPSSTTFVDSYSFENCLELVKVNLKSGTTRLNSHAFEGCTKLSQINLDFVETIETSAFWDCSSFKNVILGNNLKSVGFKAFHGVSATELIVPASLKKCDSACFEGMSSLTKLELTPGCQINSLWTFLGCKITDLFIPGSCDTIGGESFQNLPLKTIRFGEGVRRLDLSCFAGTLIESIDLSGLTYLEGQCFMECKNLKFVNFGTTLTYIGDRTFWRTKITEATLPDCLDIIKNFLPGTLEKVRIGKKTTYLDSYAFSNTKIKVLVIPDSVTRVGFGICEDCAQLEKVFFGKNVKSIDTQAFYQTHLKEVYLPAGIKSLSTYCFRNIPTLEKVVIPGGITKFDYPFSGRPSTAVFYVCESSELEKYEKLLPGSKVVVGCPIGPLPPAFAANALKKEEVLSNSKGVSSIAVYVIIAVVGIAVLSIFAIFVFPKKKDESQETV